MKKFVLILVIILVVLGLGYLTLQILSSPARKQGKFLSDADIKSATKVVQCSLQTHECVYPEKAADAGTLKVILTANGRVVKDLKVEVGKSPGAPEFFVKYSDKNGIALFENIPVGNYYVYFEKGDFPAEYGETYRIADTIEIIKNQTVEKKIDLSPGR